MNFELLKGVMDRLTSWRMPGNSISVYLRGKEVFRYTSGFSSLEKREPMAENKLFNIYSCSKVTTVVSALQLYEKGYFLLDDPLYDIIPEYRNMMVRTTDGGLVKAQKPITMRHLFTMTAGFDYNTNCDSIRKKAYEISNKKMDTLTVARCLADEPLFFEPGEKWQYSLCHDVLAAAVEAISGKKFRDYVKENIFDPLEMHDTVYHATPEMYDRTCEQYCFVNSNESDIVKLQSGEIQTVGGKLKNIGKAVSLYVFGDEYDSGGAGITTSVEDYAKLSAALAGRGKGINGNRIISESAVELLRTNQLSPAQAQTYNWPQFKGYGYALGVRTMIDKALGGSFGNIGEFGWCGAAGGMVLVDPDIELGVFYAHHMLNPQEHYYMPRIRNAVYACLNS